MPTKAKDRTDDDAAPAVAEAVAEADPGPRMLSVEYGGHSYEFKAKRLQSIQFRTLIEENLALAAVKHLLGKAQWDAFVARNADEDGDTDQAVFVELLDKIGDAAGAGNS
jgi:hypothetical protein